MKFKKTIIFILKIIFIVLLGYYVVKDIDLQVFTSELAKYSFLPLAMVVVFLFLTDAVLSVRWMLISRDKFKSSFESILVSAMANIILPARLGEMAKAIYLKQYYQKSLNRSLSLIIFERFFDVLFLAAGALFVLSFLVENPFYKNIFISIVIIQIILLMVVKYYNKPILIIAKLLPTRVLKIYSRKMIITIARKINSKTFFYTILTTTAIWIMNFTVTYVFLSFATEFNLTYVEIFVVFIVTGVGFTLPLLPAGALTFQAGYIFSLGLYGIAESEALAASLVFHVLYIITMVLPGKFILLIKKRDVSSEITSVSNSM